MKLFISLDRDGDIIITDQRITMPENPIRVREMDFPGKREIFINLSKTTLIVGHKRVNHA